MEKEGTETEEEEEKKKIFMAVLYEKLPIFAMFVAVLGISLGSVTSTKTKLEMRWHMDHG